MCQFQAMKGKCDTHLQFSQNRIQLCLISRREGKRRKGGRRGRGNAKEEGKPFNRGTKSVLEYLIQNHVRDTSFLEYCIHIAVMRKSSSIDFSWKLLCSHIQPVYCRGVLAYLNGKSTLYLFHFILTVFRTTRLVGGCH